MVFEAVPKYWKLTFSAWYIIFFNICFATLSSVTAGFWKLLPNFH